MNEEFISNQIAVYKTSKSLIEFLDKLRVGTIQEYAHIHATGDQVEDGRKIVSLIGIRMLDYTKGTGDKSVMVQANISPDEADFILSRLNAGFPEFEFRQEKIFGDPDATGYSQVTKLRILRAMTGSDGKPRNYPWYVEVENGKGLKMKSSTGGAYIKPKSYQCMAKVYVNLTDLDLFKLLNRVSHYIKAWEFGIAPALIAKAKKEIENRKNDTPMEQAS